MTPELTELARRAVACKGWRWMPGMLTMDEDRMSDEGWPDYEVMDYGASSVVETVEWRDRAKRNAIPDLTDPATLGCVLALVREKHNDPSAHVYWSALFRAWAVSFSCRGMGNYATEADALVAALEAKP